MRQSKNFLIECKYNVFDNAMIAANMAMEATIASTVMILS